MSFRLSVYVNGAQKRRRKAPAKRNPASDKEESSGKDDRVEEED